MKRQPRPEYTIVYVRQPNPYWQARFGNWLRGECAKEGLYVPSPAEIAEVLAARAEANASD